MKVATAPYWYIKAEPKSKRRRSAKNSITFVVGLCFIFGVGMLAFVIGPVTIWQITGQKTSELIVPLGNTLAKTTNTLVLGASETAKPKVVAVKSLADGFSYFSSDKKAQSRPYTSFTVAIKAVGIDQALTIVDSENFDTHLGHLPGTALPGEVGNVFVTGHSALPRFFSQTNYKTIFTPLTKLNLLDEIVVVANNKIYRYSVEKKTVVDPSDVSVIDPPDPFGKYLTLMTCVPPGLNAKRLIILARLIE